MTCRKERDGSEPRSRAARAAYARRVHPSLAGVCLVSAWDTQNLALLIKGLFQVHNASCGTSERKGAVRDAVLQPRAGAERKPKRSSSVAAATLIVLYSKLRCAIGTEQLNY